MTARPPEIPCADPTDRSGEMAISLITTNPTESVGRV
jgi:hypothetical protein